MSNWRRESAYLGRYAGSGLLNTITGFSAIFLLTAFGASPFLANFSGYLLGLVSGFLLSKKLVFRSEGKIRTEGFRYLAAFLICFLLNFLVLHLSLDTLHLNAMLAQLLAAAAYASLMYVLTRILVFR